MATTIRAEPVPPRQSRLGIWMALLAGLALVAALAVAVTLLISAGDPGATGSGATATDTRPLPAFTAVDLAGTNQLTVRVGGTQQVTVRADENLLDQVVTEVHDGVLVVSDRGSFTTRGPMSVEVTVPSLQAATLSGTGQVTVTGVAGEAFAARLSGTGTLIVSGSAQRVDASIPGDGALTLGSLLATDATVSIEGTGSATVHVTRNLDATVSGTGSIVYTGHPSSVIRNVTGVGSVTGT